MRRRAPLIAVAVLAFLAISFALARWLAVENDERDAIVELLEKRSGGPIDIVRLDSETSHTLGTAEGWSRVVWTREGRDDTIVQCVRVRRDGNPLTGRSVTLLRLSAPLRDREGSC